MSFHYPLQDGVLPLNSTVVAVDKDKNSASAVKWAIDHLNNPILILIHVTLKHINQPRGSSDGETSDYDVAHVFSPYRAICSRHGVRIKEVKIEDNDVSRALLDYVSNNCINSLILGASSRNTIARRFKVYDDVPSILLKLAPEFCSIYVISKGGKILSARAALRPIANTVAPPKQPPPAGFPLFIPNDYHSEPENGPSEDRRTPRRGGSRSAGSQRMSVERISDVMKTMPVLHDRPQCSSAGMSDVDTLGLPNHNQIASFGYEPTSDESDLGGSVMFRSLDISGQSLDFSIVGDSLRESFFSQSANELEAEMKRLKLELKQTMDMYSSACKEAISAKNKAKELHQWKLEEARRFEEAKLSEEAALAIAEMEKAKCKAALEAAEEAQRLADKEAQRRKQAEMKARREAEDKNRALTALANQDLRYRKYNIEEIEACTQKFADSLKIGEGGYGPVYRGKLDHTPVAIKVLRPDAAQGRKQFQQEVEILCFIRHPHLVLLLGACPEYGCLVYEYMNNGSLEDRLFRKGNSPPISWRKRFKISAEIATALLFLHQSKPEPLVHRDLKPANILLDRNYTSKISDVGLARLVPPFVADSVTQYHMTSAAGTFCYIDPEYQQTGMLTTKSDIYSLGIMLLQIITAKPPMGLAHQVKKAIEKDRLADVLDPTITDWPVEEAFLFAKLALKCAELRKKDRPDLASIIVPLLNWLRDFGRSHDSHSSESSSNPGHSQWSHPPIPTKTPQLKLSYESKALTNDSFGDNEH